VRIINFVRYILSLIDTSKKRTNETYKNYPHPISSC